jgi:DNA-repair protein complementing XP-A cells
LTRLNAIAKQQSLPPANKATSNANGKRPLQAIPADSTSPTAPHKRSNYTKSDNAEASGSGSNHFKRDDPTKPLKNLIGSYVDYDMALFKNSKGGFLIENDEDDPRKIKERQLMEKNKQARLDEMKKNGIMREPGSSLPYKC